MDNPNSKIKFIPHDVLFNIFLKLPIQTLLGFKSVSKSWKEIINDPEFTNTHTQKGPKDILPLCIRSWRKRRQTNLEFYQLKQNQETGFWSKGKKLVNTAEFGSGSKHIVGSCNGVVCLRSNEEFYIINPFYEHDVLKVQFPYEATTPGESYILHCGFGFDESSKRFKTVCVIYIIHADQCILKDVFVHDLKSMDNNSWSWRKLSTPSIRFEGKKYINSKSVFVNGSIYWMVVDHIVSFNLKNELFEIISLPSDLINKGGVFAPKIFNLDGNLSILVSQDPEQGNEIWVWVLVINNCSNEWVKKFRMGSPYSEIYSGWFIDDARFLIPNCMMVKKKRPSGISRDMLRPCVQCYFNRTWKVNSLL